VDLVRYMSFECISSRGQPTRAGPSAWGLGEVLTTHRETYNVTKRFARPRDFDRSLCERKSDTLEQSCLQNWMSIF
jgi:hypothetical protein